MRRMKNKGCTTVIILLRMTHSRKSIGILLINTLAYCEAQLQTYIHTMLSHSVMPDSLPPYGLYVAHQAPLSMGFSRQEYWNEKKKRILEWVAVPFSRRAYRPRDQTHVS